MRYFIPEKCNDCKVYTGNPEHEIHECSVCSADMYEVNTPVMSPSSRIQPLAGITLTEYGCYLEGKCLRDTEF